MLLYNVEKKRNWRTKTQYFDRDFCLHQAIDEKRMEKYGERRKGRGRRGELRRRKGILLVSW